MEKQSFKHIIIMQCILCFFVLRRGTDSHDVHSAVVLAMQGILLSVVLWSLMDCCTLWKGFYLFMKPVLHFI